MEPDETKRLKRLADAFGAEPTIDAVADAIIAKSTAQETKLTYGPDERGTVVGIISVLVEHKEALTAIEVHERLPPDVLGEMKQKALIHPPETIPSDEFVNIVLGHVRSACAI